jgi:hypothetical protein
MSSILILKKGRNVRERKEVHIFITNLFMSFYLGLQGKLVVKVLETLASMVRVLDTRASMVRVLDTLASMVRVLDTLSSMVRVLDTLVSTVGVDTLTITIVAGF